MNFLLDVTYTIAKDASTPVVFRILYHIIFFYIAMLVLNLGTAALCACWKYLGWGKHTKADELEDHK